MISSCPTCGIRYPASESICADDGDTLLETNDEMLGSMIGNYRVVRMLGEGGMGQVYLALHPGIGSQVAIKVLSSAATADPTLVERFFAEAQSVNKIRHEGIVNVLDLDQLPDGRPFIMMEHLLGEPLSESLARGPLALGTSAGIVIEILDALQAAHDAGVVHRDLKPDNLFLSPQGRVKILDFGVAKLMPNYETSLAKAATQTGALIGTPGYMAPEQVVGDPVSAATDLYAVGAILYEMLTGKMAFKGGSLFELFNQIVNDPPPPPCERRPELSGPYQEIILRALSKMPASRQANARQMSTELKSVSSLLGPQDWAPVRGLGTSSKYPMHADTIGQSKYEMEDRYSKTYAEAATVKDKPPSREQRPSAPPHIGDPTRSLHFSEPSPRAQMSVAKESGAQSSTQSSAQGGSRLWVGLALLALVGGGVSAILLSAGADKSEEPAAAVAEDAGLVAVAEAPGTPPPLGAPVETRLPAGEQDAGAAKDNGKRPDSTRKPPRNGKPPVPPSPKAKKPDAGSGIHVSGSVTFIETGERHKDMNIKRAPDYKPSSFEGATYAARARAMAKKIYADAYLVTFDVPGVAPSGRTNLKLADFEATYKFLSPSHSKRTLPIGIEEDRACWVYVEVNKSWVTARIVERDECKGKRRPNPKCSLKQVWERAIARGAPKSGAVANIDYLWDGWFFSIDALGISESIPDDC